MPKICQVHHYPSVAPTRRFRALACLSLEKLSRVSLGGKLDRGCWGRSLSWDHLTSLRMPVQLRTDLYNFAQLCTTLYHSVQLRTTLYHFVPCCIISCHSVPLCTTLYRHYIQFYHSVPLRTTLDTFVPLCATLYNFVPLGAALYNFLSLRTTLHHFGRTLCNFASLHTLLYCSIKPIISLT